MNPEIILTLKEKLGPENVSDKPEVLRTYSGDMTENTPGNPQLVVFARSTEDVQSVLTEADRHRIPVVPVMANTNLGGLCIPQRGGIVLSLQKMNRILEVNPHDGYMLIEPGVTWQNISDHLKKYHPGFRFTYPLSPPDTGVVQNCLMDGLANLSLRHGSASNWILATEAVLANGEIVRTGHLAFGSKTPCTNAPFSPIHGLFVGFQGSTGVVVKMSVPLWPEKKFRRRFFLMAYQSEHAFRLIRNLCQEELADDMGSLSLPTGKMLLGDLFPIYRDPNEPLLFIYLDVSSNYKKELLCKQEIIKDLIDKEIDLGGKFDGLLDLKDLTKLDPRFEKFAHFPTRLDFLMDYPGGGLTWVGTYGPTSRFREGFDKGSHIMLEHGRPPLIVARPMQGGHFGVLRWITVFNRSDPDDVARVHTLNEQLADMAVELGFFPYKTPQWVWDRYADRLDPGFCRLVRDIRLFMDPNEILNPGHLVLRPSKPSNRTS